MIFLKLIIFLAFLVPNGDHLLFNRITIQPTEAEFLSIYNPTSEPIDMSNYYLTDATKSSSSDFYYKINGGNDFWSNNYSDFIARFPDNYIRLPLGAFINHHEMPNCEAIVSEFHETLGKIKHIRIITHKKISSGEELTLNYIINKLDNPNWEFEYEVSQ